MSLVTERIKLVCQDTTLYLRFCQCGNKDLRLWESNDKLEWEIMELAYVEIMKGSNEDGLDILYPSQQYVQVLIK